VERRTFIQHFGALVLVGGCSKPTPTEAQASRPYILSDQEHRIIDKIPFKRITVKGEAALAEWQRLRTLGEGWPVVIGGDEDISRIAEQLSLNDAPKAADVLKTAAELKHPASLSKYRADEEARWKAYAKANPGKGFADVEEAPSPPVGVWPKTPPARTGLEVAENVLAQKLFDRVHILMFPTQHGYEVPAYLNWGGWNECPTPQIHVAALRKWHEDFGAELIGMNGDVLNLRVSTRPKTREEALTLAREQYAYCADIVDQGVGDLSALAAGLMDSNWWYFWWD
jgi:hypothetical protein